MPHMKMKPERKSYAKEIKPGGKATGGGKSIPVDHGPRATDASPAGAGKTGSPHFSSKKKKGMKY